MWKTKALFTHSTRVIVVDCGGGEHRALLLNSLTFNFIFVERLLALVQGYSSLSCVLHELG